VTYDGDRKICLSARRVYAGRGSLAFVYDGPTQICVAFTLYFHPRDAASSRRFCFG
jgi:hypothetical protein